MRDYRAAIVGCGRMSRGHAAAFKALGIPIVAAADIDPEALERARSDYGAKETFTDYREMLEKARPNLVSVVTAEALHCEIVVAAAERNIWGIVCEKPMAMNLAEGKRMLEACWRTEAKLTVSHQRFYMSQYAEAIERIARGDIGEVRSIEAFGMPGGALTDGTHTIHMMLTMMGGAKVRHLLAQVDGNTDRTYYGHRIEQSGVAFITFESDQYAHYTWGASGEGRKEMLHPLWDFERYGYHRFWVHGEEGRLELDGDLRPQDAVEAPPFLRIVRGREVEQIPYEWPMEKSAIAMEIEDLIRSIETDAPHPLSGESGYDTLEVIMGIYESSRRRGVVQFPVTVEDNPFLAMCEEGVFPG